MDPRAGTPAQPQDLVDVSKLVTQYYSLHPDPEVVEQQVSFGTSGHRGSAADTAFNDDHIAATTQAICEYRAGQGYTGPLFMGRDTHALSEPANATAIEVLADAEHPFASVTVTPYCVVPTGETVCEESVLPSVQR